MKLSKILSRHAAGPLVALAALSPSVTQAADMPRAQREYMTGYLTGIDSFLAEADARARPYADYHPHSSKVTHNAQTGYTDGRNCAIELAFDVVSDPRVFFKIRRTFDG